MSSLQGRLSLQTQIFPHWTPPASTFSKWTAAEVVPPQAQNWMARIWDMYVVLLQQANDITFTIRAVTSLFNLAMLVHRLKYMSFPQICDVADPDCTNECL